MSLCFFENIEVFFFVIIGGILIMIMEKINKL